MTGLSLSPLSLSLTSLRPSGGTPPPTPTPTAATLIYDATAKQFVVTNAASFGPTYVWKDETGTVVAGQTGSTLAESAAPDGLKMQAIPDGVTANASNWALAPIDLPSFVDDFNATDGTNLNGYNGWTSTASGVLQTIGGSLVAVAPNTTQTRWYNTGAPVGNKRFVVTNWYNAAASNDTAKSIRDIGFDLSLDAKNRIWFRLSKNGFNLFKVVNGVTTELVNSTSGSGFVAGVTSEIAFTRIAGRVRAYYDGNEAPASVAAGGWLVSEAEVPSTNRISLESWDTAGIYPYRYADKVEVFSLLPIQFALTSIAFDNDTLTASGTCTASVTDYDWSLVRDDGKVLLDFTDNVPVDSAGAWSINQAFPVELRGSRVFLAARPSGNVANLIFMDGGAIPAILPTQLALNVGGNGYFVDPLKDALFTISRQGGGREVLPDLYQTSTLDSQTAFAPLAHLAPDANGNPTQWLQVSDGYLTTDNWGFKWDRFDHWPDYLQGTYDVTFPPGLEWALSGTTRMSRTAYNSVAGTATLVLNDVTGGGSNGIVFTGYNGSKAAFPPSFYFNMVKQGSTETSAIHSAAIAKLQTLVSHGTGGADGTYKGALRFMDMQAINRAGVGQFSMTGFVKNKPSGSNLRPASAPQITPAEMLEMCVRVGCNMWLPVSDRMSNADKLALAQYLFANKPAGMTIYLEPSNEMWNFGFSQTGDINNRAVALGVSFQNLYVREFLNGVDTSVAPTWIGCENGTLAVFQSVFGTANPKLVPVIAWQSGLSPSGIAGMLNEQNFHAQAVKPVVAIAPYIGGGIALRDLGNYNEQSIFTKAQRDTALGAGPNYTTYLGHFFAAQAAMSAEVRLAWLSFWKSLGDYAQSKGYARDAFMPASYEYNWQHTIEGNTPAGTKADTLAAMVLALRDARAGIAQNAQNDWLMETGGLFCLFTHQGKPTTTALDQYGMWGVCDQMQFDTQEPAASIAAWKISKGV